MKHSIFAALAAVAFSSALAVAQNEDRSERWMQNCEGSWNSDRAHFCEVRNYTIAASSRLSVDGRQNGGVAFHGWDRNDVKVVALVQTNADDDNAAQALAQQIRVLTDGGNIRAEGPNWSGRSSWSVSYEIYVPTRSNLDATTANGGIAAENVQGDITFEATNGGIRIENVGGDVKAHTTNGGVTASLTESTWQGSGLDLRTTNGGATVIIPCGYNARLESGTTNGGMAVDFPITVQGSFGRRFTTQLGSGGPLVRVVTTNGGVHIRQQ